MEEVERVALESQNDAVLLIALLTQVAVLMVVSRLLLHTLVFHVPVIDGGLLSLQVLVQFLGLLIGYTCLLNRLTYLVRMAIRRKKGKKQKSRRTTTIRMKMM